MHAIRRRAFDHPIGGLDFFRSNVFPNRPSPASLPPARAGRQTCFAPSPQLGWARISPGRWGRGGLMRDGWEGCSEDKHSADETRPLPIMIP